tara:strand:- start:210 stop:398 length:189 start_codon:yes stop_codon:yes gene_type:complete
MKKTIIESEQGTSLIEVVERKGELNSIPIRSTLSLCSKCFNMKHTTGYRILESSSMRERTKR